MFLKMHTFEDDVIMVNCEMHYNKETGVFTVLNFGRVLTPNDVVQADSRGHMREVAPGTES